MQNSEPTLSPPSQSDLDKILDEPRPVRDSAERLPAGTLMGTVDPGAVMGRESAKIDAVIENVVYLVLDTETSDLFLFNEIDPKTGKKVTVAADDPRQPRLAQACMLFCDKQFNLLHEFTGYVKPDGWKMMPGATEANGLTTEFLMEHGRPITEVLDVYERAIAAGLTVIAHNAQFDTKMMRGELRRADRPDHFHETRNFCTMRKFAQHQHVKWPKLALLCSTLGVQLNAQHTAAGDAHALLGCLRHFGELGIPIVGEVHESAHHPSRNGAAATEGETA